MSTQQNSTLPMSRLRRYADREVAVGLLAKTGGCLDLWAPEVVFEVSLACEVAFSRHAKINKLEPRHCCEL